MITWLYVDLKCMHDFDCENVIEGNKQPHLSMNLKQAPMYSKIVDLRYNMVPH